MIYSSSSSSVSYTHLDVYKRQVMASVKEAADKGVDRDALAILVANKDIAVVDGNQVVLRRVWICLLYTSRCV